jgi:hypothetical protein
MSPFAHEPAYTNAPVSQYTSVQVTGAYTHGQSDQWPAKELGVSDINYNMTGFHQQAPSYDLMPTNTLCSDNGMNFSQHRGSLPAAYLEESVAPAPERLSADTDPNREDYFTLWRSLLRVIGQSAADGDEDKLRGSRTITWSDFIDDHETQRDVKNFISLVYMIYLEDPGHSKIQIQEHGKDLKKLYTRIRNLLPHMQLKAGSLGQRKSQKGN